MRPTGRYAAFIALGAGAAIVAVVCINVLRLGSHQIIVEPMVPPPVDERRAAEHLVRRMSPTFRCGCKV
jgi:hypothetical protein